MTCHEPFYLKCMLKAVVQTAWQKELMCFDSWLKCDMKLPRQISGEPVGRLMSWLCETMAQTPMAHLYVTDTPMKRALSKDLVGGGHVSRGECARALQHIVPAVLQRELGRAGGMGRGGCRQGGAAAAGTGRAVTAESCAWGRAVHYTIIQQLNITQCFLSLKLLWAYFWLKKTKTKKTQSLMYLVFFPSL